MVIVFMGLALVTPERESNSLMYKVLYSLLYVGIINYQAPSQGPLQAPSQKSVAAPVCNFNKSFAAPVCNFNKSFLPARTTFCIHSHTIWSSRRFPLSRPRQRLFARHSPIREPIRRRLASRPRPPFVTRRLSEIQVRKIADFR